MPTERFVYRQGDHLWRFFDDEHRECEQCGLRVFRSRRGDWVLVNYNGQPDNLRLLGDGSSSWGRCVPKPKERRVVLIEYTGDPDVHPGCERIMHRIAGEPDLALVVDDGPVFPVCSSPLTWWEVGPPRNHAGWTWCAGCWSAVGRFREAQRGRRA